MTIEIRELVIQAKVASTMDPTGSPTTRSIAQQKSDEARMIETISQSILDKIREDGGAFR